MSEAQTTTGTDDGTAADTETKRARVRRLLIEPAQRRGMRFPKRMAEEERRKTLVRLCDAVAYLDDAALAALADWVRSHGDGADRSFWPPVVGIISIAEAICPRPLEEAPGVASWFGSRAGPAAVAENRLVAEFLFWERFKRPPMSDRDKAGVARQAAEMRGDAHRIEDQLRRGVEPGAERREFLRWYREIEARALALVKAGEEKRAAEGDAA